MQRLQHYILLAAALGLVAPGDAAGQGYPNKPIRMIIPVSTGGIADILARLTADHVGRGLGTTVVVENKSGAGGNIGTDALAKSAPDGYTIGFINVGFVAINPWIYKEMPFDPIRDLAAVATVGEVPHVLAIHAALAPATVRELVDHAKRNPGKLNYGSAGIGTPPHLSGDLFARLVGIEMVHVPYRGAGQVAVDLATGQIQLAFLGLGSMRGQISAGQVRPLAVARKTRLAARPDVPTFTEAGYASFDPTSWFGVMAPAATPAAIIATLNRTVNAMLDDPVVQTRLQESGTEPLKEAPEQFAARIRGDYEKYREIVRAAGVKPE